MILPRSALLALVLIIGFLTSSTLYFYAKSSDAATKKSSNEATFDADLPQLTASQSSQKVDELTKPALSKGRLSYPKNVYTVEAKETLFGIGAKFGIDWKLIKLTNGITNENLIQAGYTLVIPRIEVTTDLYRVNFQVDEDQASALNRDLRDTTDDPLFDPVEVAKRNAVPYFGVLAESEFTLLERDESRGTALVQAKTIDNSIVVGLFQPKEKGKNGFWVVLYIELRD